MKNYIYLLIVFIIFLCICLVCKGCMNLYEGFVDGDADGYGDASSSGFFCLLMEGYTSDSSDCDDADASINPDAEEIIGDGIDQDCDGADLEEQSVYEQLGGSAGVNAVLDEFHQLGVRRCTFKLPCPKVDAWYEVAIRAVAGGTGGTVET